MHLLKGPKRFSKDLTLGIWVCARCFTPLPLMTPLKLYSITRKTKLEPRYSPHMGRLFSKVTYIKKAVAGIPVKTLYKYRETYYGKVKDCENCELSR